MSNPALATIAATHHRKVEERFAARHLRQKTAVLRDAAFSLERLLCDPEMGKFPASHVQRALMRAVDGQAVFFPPPLEHERSMLFHFGCAVLPNIRPRVVILRTGIRAAKSLISAIGLLRSVLTCQYRRPPEEGETPGPDGLVGVREGELVRAAIVGPTLKQTEACFDHIVGTMRASPVLSTMLVKVLATSVTIRRPDGTLVRIERVAAASGGSNLRSTWLAGALFDEADFHGAEDAAVNLISQLDAARTRLLNGAQIWVVSSPWSDSTPFHKLFTDAWGKPDADTLAFHSDSRSMNPTLSRTMEAAERAKNPENAAREYDAIPLRTNSKRWFPEDCIEKAVNKTRPMNLPYSRTLHYAGADWGLSRNSSALAISRWNADIARAQLAFHLELQPTEEESLRVKEIVKEFAQHAMSYGCRTIRSDHYLASIREQEMADFIAALPDGNLRRRVPADEPFDPNRDAVAELFIELRRRMQAGLIEIPNDPRLIEQFRGVTSTPMPGGAVKILLPKQGTSHGDLLFAVALSLVACPVVEKEVDTTSRQPAADPYAAYASPERGDASYAGIGAGGYGDFSGGRGSYAESGY